MTSHAISTTDACVMIDARYLNGRSSGIGRYTEHLIHHLLELDDGLRLRLITHRRRPRPIDHPRVECQTWWAAPNSLSTRLWLSRCIDFQGVDLFHSPFNILPANLDVPAIFTLHDIMWLIDPSLCTSKAWKKVVTANFYRTFIPHSVRQAAAILTVSHHSRQSIAEYFPDAAKRTAVSYNGVESYFHPVSNADAWPHLLPWLTPTSRFVLIVGQGTPYKNHTGAVRAFIKAFGDDPDAYLVMVRRLHNRARGPLRELIDDPRIRSRIIQLDYVTKEQLRALYSMATVFLFPSLYEGFGLPALEAMACGTAVITSDRGAPAEVCAGGATRVDPTDTEAIATALRRLFDDESHRQAVETRGLRRAAQFQWRDGIKQVLAVYREVLSRGASS